MHLTLVIDEAARAVAMLRGEGRAVFLHCVQAHSRTASVAARYSVIACGLEPGQALQEVCSALPAADPRAVMVLGTRG